MVRVVCLLASPPPPRNLTLLGDRAGVEVRALVPGGGRLLFLSALVPALGSVEAIVGVHVGSFRKMTGK